MPTRLDLIRARVQARQVRRKLHPARKLKPVEDLAPHELREQVDRYLAQVAEILGPIKNPS